MRQLTFALTTLLMLGACSRQHPLPGETTSGESALQPAKSNEIEERLYPPELVMQHQSRLGLEAQQRESILKEVERAQSEMLRLQWAMSAKKEKLASLLDAEKPDEAQTLEAAEQVMALEDKLKASHLTMLVRVKNALTAQQQARLRELRARP
ncbi:MAG: periplasmic heavy metal sensor [Deltaproteobacteria bacterium]|nr:periplasmic heavy metal sensor [Deltaproteobacteria bacterium]